MQIRVDEISFASSNGRSLVKGSGSMPPMEGGLQGNCADLSRHVRIHRPL